MQATISFLKTNTTVTVYHRSVGPAVDPPPLSRIRDASGALFSGVVVDPGRLQIRPGIPSLTTFRADQLQACPLAPSNIRRTGQ